MIDGIIIHSFVELDFRIFVFGTVSLEHDRPKIPSCRTDFSKLPISKSLGFLMEHCWQGRSEKSQKKAIFTRFYAIYEYFGKIGQKGDKSLCFVVSSVKIAM